MKYGLSVLFLQARYRRIRLSFWEAKSLRGVFKKSARNIYDDYIIIDTPPLGSVIDSGHRVSAVLAMRQSFVISSATIDRSYKFASFCKDQPRKDRM
ncbi:MAG: hypothetical protein ACLUUO_13175 [Sellimonas intestinalis]